MKTRYYNEYTNEIFDTEKEALESEKKYLEAKEAKKKKDSERAARAKEVDEAMKVAIEAKKKYQDLVRAFCKDYKSYHFSTNDMKNYDFFDFLNFFDW